MLRILHSQTKDQSCTSSAVQHTTADIPSVLLRQTISHAVKQLPVDQQALSAFSHLSQSADNVHSRRAQEAPTKRQS